MERLQKILARAGLGSRRSTETLIREGRVSVDGRVAELGSRADPDQATITVDGRPVGQPAPVSYVVHKPLGYVCSLAGQGKQTVTSLIADSRRLFPAGRLDADSSGLVICTNDGALANLITHPRHEIAKTYKVMIAGRVSRDAVRRLEEGVDLPDGPALPCEVRVKRNADRASILVVTVREGRNRLVRRLLGAVGHAVVQLKRVAIGPVRLGHLPEGAFRPLLPEERRALLRAAAGGRGPKAGPARGDAPARHAGHARRKPARRRPGHEGAGGKEAS